jgi:dsDNA-specific endonuclease/ATPase MutS2
MRHDGIDDVEDDEPPPDEIVLEIEDVLDLHSFPPREIAGVVRDYLDAACERGFEQVRIIHGRGVGVQRAAVRSILERDPRVIRFGDAPDQAGGRGATWASLRPGEP